MIDLHCHILPGIDDGPGAMDGALELAGELAGAGVHTVAATPHLRDDHPDVRAPELAARCAELANGLRAARIELEVIPAGEVDLVRALEATDEELRLASFGQRGTDLLLESPYGPLPTSFDEHVFHLSVRGYRILLAHPERNPTFQQEPERLSELVGRGVLLQVTATSLIAGARSRRLARSLVAEGMAHVLASDAHGASGPLRAPLRAGVAEARSLVGPYADWMVEDAPAAILAGEQLPPPPPVKRRQRRGLRALLRRSP